MTTIAAVKKGKRLCIASDGLSTFGSRKETGGTHIHEEGKFIEIGPNLVGISGHSSWRLVLKNYFSGKKTTPLWKTPDQIFELFHRMHGELKEQYYLSPPNLQFLPFESSEFQLLIVNACGIFEVEHSRVVRQYNNYSAIGTGEDYALGAMSAIYDMARDPEEIAKAGVEAAAQFDRKTELPLFTRCIDLT
jgi:ATP-dependent HslUV protease subunit HslV